MVSSFDSVQEAAPLRVVVPVGATLAVFMQQYPGEKALLIKYYSGGTLEILQASNGSSILPGGTMLFGVPQFTSGSTQTPAMLAAMSGTGYLVGTTEVLTFNGPTKLYLSATGATVIAMVIRGL